MTFILRKISSKVGAALYCPIQLCLHSFEYGTKQVTLRAVSVYNVSPRGAHFELSISLRQLFLISCPRLELHHGKATTQPKPLKVVLPFKVEHAG